ncbi:MAG: class I SAM-dependent methyltransferase [Deltaproteobacteria bacterium]
MSNAPTDRFSSRAPYYDKYRPGYPPKILDILAGECNLLASSVIADVGSGTGILSRLLLGNGNAVFGVEPNARMRLVAEESLRGYPKFTSVAGSAESSCLSADLADFIVVGQAFHWFDVDGARREFARILKRGGFVMLVWNDRRATSTPFLQAYEDLLLRFATDYQKVNSANFSIETIARFFGGSGFKSKRLDNFQQFDYEGLAGRLLSMSFAPLEGENHAQMMEELRRIFLEHQENGRVTFEYDTRIYYGRIVE